MIYWKGQGQTFNQIVSSMRLNKRTTTAVHDIFKALPAKHYRREIASIDTHGGVVSVDEMLRPSGAIKTANTTTGLCTSQNINPPNNSSEYPHSVVCFANVSGKDDDARRLLRSAGNRRLVGKPVAIASNRQYLVSRRRTFQQSLFNHPTDVQGVFRPNGLCNDDCEPEIYHNPSNKKFQVQGGVTSSSRLERLKLDTVTKVAYKSRTSAAPTTANTLIQNPQTVKNRMNLVNRECAPSITGC